MGLGGLIDTYHPAQRPHSPRWRCAAVRWPSCLANTDATVSSL